MFAVEADDEVEEDAVLAPDPSADSNSDKLSEPSPLASSALIRLEARFEAAVSKLDVADEDEDEVEEDAVLALASAWAEVRLDKVSELKRSEPLLEGSGGGGPGGGPCAPWAESADWPESAGLAALATVGAASAINCWSSKL